VMVEFEHGHLVISASDARALAGGLLLGAKDVEELIRDGS